MMFICEKAAEEDENSVSIATFYWPTIPADGECIDLSVAEAQHAAAPFLGVTIGGMALNLPVPSKKALVRSYRVAVGWSRKSVCAYLCSSEAVNVWARNSRSGDGSKSAVCPWMISSIRLVSSDHCERGQSKVLPRLSKVR